LKWGGFFVILLCMKNEFLNRLSKAGSVEADILSTSRYFGQEDFYDTGYPLLNLALSGRINGGFTNGLTMFAGPSKHFKSSYLCICMAAFLKAKPDGVVLFYDTEFGSKKSYFQSFGVDTDRVFHIPIANIEELKFDIMKRLKVISKEDDVMIAVDSFGNVPSKKEVTDAETENEAADMTRAKQLKSLGRMITPQLTLKGIPCVGVNHVYDTQELYSKQIMSGGTGLMYSSDTVIFVGRSQNKDGKELLGYNFDLTIAKSRYVKEGSRFPVVVRFDEGVDKYSGIFDLMLDNTDLVEQSGAWYLKKGDDKKVRRSTIEEDLDFMESLIKDEAFVRKIESKYILPIHSGKTETQTEILLDEDEEV
jgi:RecA/RadA recombinase